ncbi:hypothetical protein E2C01_082141 [Portunus trituberculatus]|uniref:Uncharacterized protein n=1 Tax=Portunus trituberculatus TaxID=210409 RepID=A0A5B7IYE8_PORTR|nr:hypothetical protein [Portunus trituberculatus]
MHNCFSHIGAHLFNAVPDTIRNLTGVTPDLSKKRLDRWLSTIPDELPIPGHSSSTGNSHIIWRVNSKAELPGHSRGPPQLRPSYDEIIQK